MRPTAVGSANLVALMTACGGGQTQGSAFDPLWSNDDGAGIAAFQEVFSQTEVPLGADVAVGVETGGKALVGVDLGDKAAPWRFVYPLDARPAVAGGVVVGTGGGEVFALDARTGQELWRRPAQGRLRGVGDDGRTTLVSLEPVSGRGATLLAVTRDGAVVRQIEDRAAVGTPAVVDRFAFLPWNGQYVTVYDLVRGRETARVLLRTQTNRAFAQGGALFFGELTATRFDGQIRFGSVARASTLTLPTNALEGAARWFARGPEPLAAGPSDGFRVYARPTTSGPPGIASGRFAASRSRAVLGLDAASGAIAWTRAQTDDVLGGAAATDGFVLCDAAGKVSFVDAVSGTLAGEMSLGRALDACVVQVDALTLEGKLGGGARR